MGGHHQPQAWPGCGATGAEFAPAPRTPPRRTPSLTPPPSMHAARPPTPHPPMPRAHHILHSHSGTEGSRAAPAPGATKNQITRDRPRAAPARAPRRTHSRRRYPPVRAAPGGGGRAGGAPPGGKVVGEARSLGGPAAAAARRWERRARMDAAQKMQANQMKCRNKVADPIARPACGLGPPRSLSHTAPCCPAARCQKFLVDLLHLFE